MSKDKAEEKPYLQDLFEHMNNEHGLILTQSEMLEILSICGKEYDNVQFELGEIERQHTDLSTENAQLREALREVISRYEILERSVMVHPDYVFGDDNDEWHTFIDCGKEPLNEAKQLLTDKE